MKLSDISIRNALIATITLALILTTFFTTRLSGAQVNTVFDEFNENGYFPALLGKVEASIRAELNVPIALSRGLEQNDFLRQWAINGESEKEWPNIQQYFNNIKNKNDAAVVFWVSKQSLKYYQNDGILKNIATFTLTILLNFARVACNLKKKVLPLVSEFVCLYPSSLAPHSLLKSKV